MFFIYKSSGLDGVYFYFMTFDGWHVFLRSKYHREELTADHFFFQVNTCRLSFHPFGLVSLIYKSLFYRHACYRTWNVSINCKTKIPTDLQALLLYCIKWKLSKISKKIFIETKIPAKFIIQIQNEVKKFMNIYAKIIA